MSVLSLSCCSLLSGAFAFLLVSASGCGTDAKGVDDCRDINSALCAAAKNCGLLTDVDGCKRYYRDDCLHGLPVASPGSKQVKACVAAINAAGTCAAQAAGSDAPLDACDPPLSAPSALTACAVVDHPELATECAFLAPGLDAGVTPPAGGAGGADNPGDAGASGSAGADSP